MRLNEVSAPYKSKTLLLPSVIYILILLIVFLFTGLLTGLNGKSGLLQKVDGNVLEILLNGSHPVRLLQSKKRLFSALIIIYSSAFEVLEPRRKLNIVLSRRI